MRTTLYLDEDALANAMKVAAEIGVQAPRTNPCETSLQSL